MSKVTSKLQVTIPKAIAQQHGIQPGDEISWDSAGDTIRVVTESATQADTLERRLQLFDSATDRQAIRNRKRGREGQTQRGWTREELYTRGRTD